MQLYTPKYKYYYSASCIQYTSNGYKLSLITTFTSDNPSITTMHINTDYSELVVYYI